MSFDELKKYGSMAKAFQAGKDKDEAETTLTQDVQNSIDQSYADNDGTEMSDDEFALLEQDLEFMMLKVNRLQKKYRNQTSKNFVLPIRL